MKQFFLSIIIFFTINGFSQTTHKEYFEKSKIFTETKEFDKALIAIENSLQTDSLNRSYLLQKAKILYFKNNCKESLNALEKLVLLEDKFDDETISYFTDITDCLGKNDVATEVLEQYVKENKSPEILTRLAQRYFNAKNYDKSIYYYQQIVKLNPNDVDAIIDLSRILYAFKSSKEAKEEFSKGLETNKNSIPLLTYLASCYHNDKDYNKAIDIENQIIKLAYKPEHIAGRAMLYELQGKNKEAYEDYKKIIELVKCNPEYYSKILQYEFENRLYDKVIENSYKVIACNKSYEDSILDGLYTSLFFCGEFEKGTQYLDKKLALKPTNFNPYYLKSLILIKNKEYENIIKYLDLASKSSDADNNDLNNVTLLKLVCFLLREDYDGLVEFWKRNDSIPLSNTISFTFLENIKTEKTELTTYFNKNTGVINSSIIIPTKTINHLKEKYNLKIL